MRYYNLKQVAEILSISYKYARTLVQSGRLEAMNIGLKKEKVWRVSEEAIQKFSLKNNNLIIEKEK